MYDDEANELINAVKGSSNSIAIKKDALEDIVMSNNEGGGEAGAHKSAAGAQEAANGVCGEGGGGAREAGRGEGEAAEAR